jgi:hypothetical protein
MQAQLTGSELTGSVCNPLQRKTHVIFLLRRKHDHPEQDASTVRN